MALPEPSEYLQRMEAPPWSGTLERMPAAPGRVETRGPQERGREKDGG